MPFATEKRAGLLEKDPRTGEVATRFGGYQMNPSNCT